MTRRPSPRPDPGEHRFLLGLLRSETTGGLIALVAAAAAVVWMNLDASSYVALRGQRIGPLDVEHWAADGALTLFFFVAGLELKRELVVGSLRRPVDAAVPVVAACCGVAVPAGLYAAVTLLAGHRPDLGGWAIPAATDIAFALAVLAVAGSALPTSLRAFLLTLAVVDDLIVIVVIATVYTDRLRPAWLAGAVLLLGAYAVAQRLRIRTPVALVPIALATWWCVHESGVHATVAGVALGLLTRVRPDPGEDASPAERLEHVLSPVSAGIAVPFFALLSAGVRLPGGLTSPSALVVAVVLALVVGKPVGILGGAWAVTRLTSAELAEDTGWRDLVGVGMLGGVGFTVSLLVSDLAFDDARRDTAKAAVLVGSLVAALLGAAILGRRNRRHRVR
jgi:NhaA family Na+:H+ antiporter